MSQILPAKVQPPNDSVAIVGAFAWRPICHTKIRNTHQRKSIREVPTRHVKVEGMTLYTNRGLGTNSYWLLINCPPEITVITLL